MSTNIVKSIKTEDDRVSETFRQKIKIPSLPNDTEELKHIPSFNMHRSEIVNGSLFFENENDFYDVLRTGFFLLKIPDYMDLQATDNFVSNFYKEKDGSPYDKYKGYKHHKLSEDYQGYFDRPHDQWENFYIEKANWNKFLPHDVHVTGAQLADLGISILKNVLRKLQLPEFEWDKVTGGLASSNGHQMLAFNHFRPEKPVRGTKLHRDSGWVTVLRSTDPGLIGLVENKLYSINPVPGYFTINFGSSFEVLTQKLKTPVRANIHGVVKTLRKNHLDDGRKSYVIFLDSDLSGSIYRFENGEFKAIQSMKDFAIQEVSRTYDDGELL